MIPSAASVWGWHSCSQSFEEWRRIALLHREDAPSGGLGTSALCWDYGKLHRRTPSPSSDGSTRRHEQPILQGIDNYAILGGDPTILAAELAFEV